MKRSRGDINTEYTRNVKAKRDAEQNIGRLEKEFNLHPETIAEKLPESLRFLVTDGRLTSFEINYTVQNLGWMQGQTWLCKFTLDRKVYMSIFGRIFSKALEPTWNGISCLNEYNKSWFEGIGRKEVELANVFNISELRAEIISGKTVEDMWTWARKSQYKDEPGAIALLVHLHYFPTDEKPKELEELTSKPSKSNVTPYKLEGVEIINLPVGSLDK